MKNIKLKGKKGITLIALIITIVVMLILVAVTVNIVINSGLLDTAKRAGNDYKTAWEAEQRLGEEAQFTIGGVTYNSIEEYRREQETIATGENTTPWLPDGATITNNDLSTGLTIKTTKTVGNTEYEYEWVWIEVPTSIYANTEYNSNGDMEPASSEDYVKIRYCLETYAGTLISRPSNYKDYWYYYPSRGTVYSKDPLTGTQYKNDGAVPTEEEATLSTYITLTDGTEGTGLTYAQYQTKYKAMLKSVYENGGFYIGKYETGTGTARGNRTDALTTPVITKNAYPYNYVTISQAEAKAEEMATRWKNNKFIIWSTMGLSIKTFK